MDLFITSFFSGIITWILLSKIIPWLSVYFLVNPNERSSHTKPIPSGGGLAFVVVTCISCSLFRFWLPIYCLPLAIVGFIDDFIGISSIIRYVFQVATVVLIIFKSSLIYDFLNLFYNFEYFFIFIILLIIGTAIINFVNFMDGLDGLIVSNFIVILVFSSILSEKYIFLMIGTLFGFLFFNWHPAKVFMGDVGSTFLGAIFFGILANSNSANDSFLLFLIAFPLLGDAFICVLRRFFMGHNIFLPHKLHLYQRLNQAGLSHSTISILYATLTLFISLTALVKPSYIYFPIILSILIGFYFDKYIAVPFASRKI